MKSQPRHVVGDHGGRIQHAEELQAEWPLRISLTCSDQGVVDDRVHRHGLLLGPLKPRKPMKGSC